MSKFSDSQIKRALSATDVRHLAELFVEAHDDCYGPALGMEHGLYLKCRELTECDTSLVNTMHTSALRNP